MKNKGKPRFTAGAKGRDVFLTSDGHVAVRTQALAAKTVGVAERTLREWLSLGCPRRPEGYCIREILAWDASRRTDDDPDLVAGGTSPALERYRDERAKLARMERLRMEGRLVWLDDMTDAFEPWARLLREHGDRLGRRFGPEATEMHNEICAELGRRTVEILESLGDHDEDGRRIERRDDEPA